MDGFGILPTMIRFLTTVMQGISIGLTERSNGSNEISCRARWNQISLSRMVDRCRPRLRSAPLRVSPSRS
jgi:hypothetical protein